ncbi:DUF3784 domain-containing protein [Natronorubrum halophilum]|uniref:DUF3784 domain-containing protein n=1 Tax=Natronorubrum halophilum TaxID=1702106 RepID=UPI000EF654DE|nr:DUF3784 domain-containing protein [Natronorubrum halophilum]
MSSGAVLALLVAAGFAATLGILIKYFGVVQLVAGYDPDRVTDDEGLADFIGTNILYVATLLVLVGVVEYTEPFDGDGTEAVWIAFVVVLLGLTARMIVGSRRYEASE